MLSYSNPNATSVQKSLSESSFNLLEQLSEIKSFILPPKVGKEIQEKNNITIDGDNNGAKGSSVVHSGNNDFAMQKNNVTYNFGVTGISGNGHTINVYSLPEEFVELLKSKLL
jgi:hypothetical protein